MLGFHSTKQLAKHKGNWSAGTITVAEICPVTVTVELIALYNDSTSLRSQRHSLWVNTTRS